MSLRIAGLSPRPFLDTKEVDMLYREQKSQYCSISLTLPADPRSFLLKISIGQPAGSK